MTKSIKMNQEQETSIDLSCTEMLAVDGEAKIAELAYFKAESRGFTPGHELNDWLEAEQELMNS